MIINLEAAKAIGLTISDFPALPVPESNMRGLGTGLGSRLGNGSFGPKTLVVLEAAFDEVWLTLKLNGNDRVRPDELARCILRLATQDLAPLRD